MAIIVCPNCGKKVTDRMEICPHCHAVLIEQTEQPNITKEAIMASAKDSIVGVAIATVLTIVLVLIWSVIATIMAGYFMGNEAAIAVGSARGVFLSENLTILIVGAVLYCVLSALFNKKSGTQFVIGIIILVCKYAVVLVEDNLWEEEHEVILPLSRAIGVMVVTDVFNFDLAIRQEYMTFREDVANNLLVIRIFLNKYLH